MLTLKSSYVRNGIIAALLAIPTGSQAFSGLTSYSTRLTKHACYNSKGKKLKNVSQILRQERALFHQKKAPPHHNRKKHLIAPTQDETFFASHHNRNIFSSATINIPKKLATKIKKCASVDYTVHVYSEKNIHVRPGLINTRAG